MKTDNLFYRIFNIFPTLALEPVSYTHLECGVPVLCLSGGLGRDYQAIYASGIDAAASTTPRPMTLEDCLAAGPALIEDAAERLARLIAVGIRIAPCMIV